MKQIHDIEIEKLFHDLAHKEWACSAKVFPLEFCHHLAEKALDLQREGLFRAAAIGRGASKSHNPSIRGDVTLWIEEESASLLLIEWREQLELMRTLLNQSFYLGLKSFETHFAIYPPQAEYQKHIDNHRGSNARAITFILYLNDHWKKGDGGELSLFDPRDQKTLMTQIEPHLGTFVLFRSEVFPHQVEKNFQQRLSLTGWFRTDSQ